MNNNEKQKFPVKLKDGQEKIAQVLSIVYIDNKKYAVYSVDDNNDSKIIMASYVKEDEDGYDVLVDITDVRDKEKITNYIKSMMI